MALPELVPSPMTEDFVEPAIVDEGGQEVPTDGANCFATMYLIRTPTSGPVAWLERGHLARRKTKHLLGSWRRKAGRILGGGAGGAVWKGCCVADGDGG